MNTPRQLSFLIVALLLLLGGTCVALADDAAASVRRDIEYGNAGGERLLLDASVPNGAGPFPIAILVHGGGWSGGDKSGSNKPGDGADVSPWFPLFTSAQFTWFSINYRLAPAHRWPACLEDVQTAIRWAKAHAAEFKGDPRRIVIVGHSAGGQLACLAALKGADEATRVQVAIGFAAVTDPEFELPTRGGLSTSLQALFDRPKELTPESLALLRAFAPINAVDSREPMPAFLLVHGDADKTVPLQESLNFQAKVRAAGGTCDLITVAGAGHRLADWAKLDPTYPRRLAAWLQENVRSRLSEPAPATATAARSREPDAVVAADGSGQYKSVVEAINAAPQLTSAERPWIIYVKSGTYPEVVYVQREKRFVRLIGENAATTKITASLSAKMPGPDGKPIGTFRTPTVYIDADDFTVENLTLENAAGAVGQALAVRVDGDRVVFRNCRFLGWQDTILANRGRQYFADCFIAGATDFIFGGATAFFDRCEIHIAGDGYITAASTPKEQLYGFVFKDCRITAANPQVKTYLGRPWRDYAAVTFLNTEMSTAVRPVGWHNWNQPPREKTSRYVEFGSRGPGADAAARAPWAHTLDADAAHAITAATVLRGSDGWSPETSGATRILP